MTPGWAALFAMSAIANPFAIAWALYMKYSKICRGSYCSKFYQPGCPNKLCRDHCHDLECVCGPVARELLK